MSHVSTEHGTPVVLAIDGPGGAGKSTVARLLAERLGVKRLDTGAIYRAVSVAVLDAGVEPTDAEACALVAGRVRVRFDGDRVLLDGRDVSEEIRSRRVTSAVSSVSAHSGLRRILVEQQRDAAAGDTWIVEGRDIGTVVFPDARLKVFLTASTGERATRRAVELGETDIDAVESEIRRRDHEDATRPESPMRPAEDAITVDTTATPVDEVVDRIEMLWRQRCAEGMPAGPSQL